jgi:hypothetical protein
MKYRLGMASQITQVLASISEFFFSLLSSKLHDMKSRTSMLQLHHPSIAVTFAGEMRDTNFTDIKFPFQLRR